MQQPPTGTPGAPGYPGAVPGQQPYYPPPQGAQPGQPPPQQQQPYYPPPQGAPPQYAPPTGQPPAGYAPPGAYLQAPANPQAGNFAPGIPDDLFQKIADSNATANGTYLADGDYVLAIKECKLVSAFGGWTWVTKFIIVEALPQLGMYQLGGEPVDAGVPGAIQVEPNKVGSEADFTSQLENKQNPNAAGNVKAFMLALTNTQPSQFDPAQFKTACGLLVQAAQPMRGALIRAHTVRKKNQGRSNSANKGKLLVLPNWSHIPQTPDEIRARRGLIETGKPILPLGILAPVAAQQVGVAGPVPPIVQYAPAPYGAGAPPGMPPR